MPKRIGYPKPNLRTCQQTRQLQERKKINGKKIPPVRAPQTMQRERPGAFFRGSRGGILRSRHDVVSGQPPTNERTCLRFSFMFSLGSDRQVFRHSFYRLLSTTKSKYDPYFTPSMSRVVRRSENSRSRRKRLTAKLGSQPCFRLFRSLEFSRNVLLPSYHLSEPRINRGP